MQPKSRSSSSGLFVLNRAIVQLAAVAVLTLGAGCQNWGGDGGDQIVNQYYPKIELSESDLDYDAIRVGQYYYRSIVIGNQGRVNLEVTGLSVDGDDRFAYAFELDKSFIAPGGQAILRITYTPPAEGDDIAVLTINNNDPDYEAATVDLRGYGVLPDLQLSEESLSFAGVSAGESASQDLEITNDGTGPLQLQGIELSQSVDEAFTLQLPNSFLPGFELLPGLSLKARVTYEPPFEVLTGEEAENASDEPVLHEGELVITSDDPRRSTAAVQLWGSSEPPPADPAPTADILTPNDGSRVFVGNTVKLSGVVGDEYDPLNQLAVSWASSIDGIIGYSIPDVDGYVSLDTDSLTVGDHLITLYVYDASAQPGFDQIELKIWNESSEFEYVLAGQYSEYSYINVDDNIEIYRIDQDTGDETPCLVIFDDIAHTSDSATAGPPIGPTVCNVRRGDQIRIIAYDRYAAEARLDAIYLYYRDEEHQPMVESVTFSTGANGQTCFDSPSKHQWYAPDDVDYPYVGDCVFYEQTFTVEIPAIPEGE